MLRRRMDATSPIIPMPGHRETDCSQKVTDVINLSLAGVKLIPNLVTRVEEHPKKTFGKLDLTNLPVHTATCCVFK